MSALLDELISAINEAEKRGVTRYQIAQKTGLSQAALSRLVNGELTTVRLDTLERIAAFLGLTVKLEQGGKKKSRER